jgi:hypothetical protein
MLSRRAALFAGCAGVVITAAVFLWWSFREPRYDGRSLSEWLSRLGVREETYWSPYPDAAERERAREAVSRIGTNALPYLMRWIEYREPDEAEFVRWLRTLFGRDRREANAKLRAEEAAAALQYIRDAPDSVVPGLARLARDQDYRIVGRATHALTLLGEHSALALTVLMTNDSWELRLHGILGTTRLRSEQSTKVVPYLVRCLNDPEALLRRRATNTLLRIAPQALQKLADE